MFDAGIWEMALILLLSLIIIGPKRLPEVASKLGEWVFKFRKMQSSFHHIYNHYSDYPNAGKHMIGLDSNSENSKKFKEIKKEFDEIKKEVESPFFDLNQRKSSDNFQDNETKTDSK